MRVQVVGLQRVELEKMIRNDFPDLELVAKAPEVIISYGGDGTLLYAERNHPLIPKAALRNSKRCNLCSNLTPEKMLGHLSKGEYTIHEYMKITGEAHGRTMTAVNDVIVGSPGVNGTLRVNLYANGQQCTDEIVGDGIVIATPIGSSGYYQSITRSNFQTGIGVAFNNSVDTVDHLLLSDDAVLEVEIVRGPGVMAVDNSEEQVELSAGDWVTVKRSKEKISMLRFPGEEGLIIGEV